ncbi:hypothetical protein DEAC_c14880 [Desulfosporosinus acididurans]|uniref:Flavinylation-associated cytochrome domain-containing protein n=1 Tax=Desulfosporosinus acididurans TaxID=476652 RepID=A0A0J1FTM2_9FIRM|nr:DUF4405 domain-containing protein [Desulfosporosinus acididurans]KLU66820.1 hypothetical protein DEAC_c14880 [Desulfosporosinus acididurans]
MQNNNIRLALDTIMFINLVLVMTVSRGAFHEVAGIGMGCLVLTHSLINLQWVKKVSARLFDAQLPSKTRFTYLMNLLLLGSMLLTIVGGISMSQVLFPGIGLRHFRQIHSLTANILLVLVGIHMGLHGQRLLSNIKRIFNTTFQKMIGNIAVFLLVSFLLFGGYKLISDHVPNVELQQQAPNNPNLGLDSGAGRRHNTGNTRGPHKLQPQSDGRFKNEHRNSSPIGFILNSVIILAIAVMTHTFNTRHSNK